MTDALCLEDLDLYGRELDDPLEELAQDIVHMLLETYGSNPDVPQRGIGLEDSLSGPVDPYLGHRIETALLDDDRISAADVKITDTGGGSFRIDLSVQANDDVLGLLVQYAADGSVKTTRTT